MYEQIGMPMRLRMFSVSGDALKNACQWIAPFVGFWSPALLIRAGNVDGFKKDGFLYRSRVATMNVAVVNWLYDWCLKILQREIANLVGQIPMGTAQESLFEILPEVLSRLAFRVDAQRLATTFPIALGFHNEIAVRAHIRLHESCKPWFQRLFEASDDKLLLDWLPVLIKAPLFEKIGHLPFPETMLSPDPMYNFPVSRVKIFKDDYPDKILLIQDATNWLFRRAASESGEGLRRAMNRLTNIYHLNMMTPEQQSRFGELLWSNRLANQLPDRKGFLAFGFFNLPSPPESNAISLIRNYILQLPSEGLVQHDAQGRQTIPIRWNEHPFVLEATFASKPVIQLAGEPNGEIDWSVEESQQLYVKAFSWWQNDRAIFDSVKEGVGFGLFSAEPVLKTLERIGQFLSRAILPRMEWANEENWQQLIGWLKDARQFGAYPTLALPYILINRPEHIDGFDGIIFEDLNSNIEAAVASAAMATRHWIHLSSIKKVPPPPQRILSTLIERVILRRKPGIMMSIYHLSYLIMEKRDFMGHTQIASLISSLMAWHDATILPVSDEIDGEFSEVERPDLRAVIGQLASALAIWHVKMAPSTVEPSALKFWREICETDPLPEVRRAFTVWRNFE